MPCVPMPECLRTGRAARPAGVGAPKEGVLVSFEPNMCSVRGGAETPRAQRCWPSILTGTLALPQRDSRDSRDWCSRGPSNVSAACAKAVISGGLGCGNGMCRQGPEPAPRGGRLHLFIRLERLRGLVYALWSHLQGRGLHFRGELRWELGERFWPPECETDLRRL